MACIADWANQLYSISITLSLFDNDGGSIGECDRLLTYIEQSICLTKLVLN